MLIAQISDFHLSPEGVSAYGVADTVTPLKRTVKHINALVPRPDVVLITGDLVCDGSAESYSQVYELLSSLSPPFIIVPGNHDLKRELRKAFPDHDYLKETLEENGESYICFSDETFPVRLIGLDTVTPGDHGGSLGKKRLLWLNQKLRARPDAPAIIFMHHPPFASAIGHMDKKPFKGRDELAEIIRDHPQVERILCGHLHRPIFRRFAGTLVTACPAIGMQIVLDLRSEAPSNFILEPPALMLHFYTRLWDDEPALLTHISIVAEHPGQYAGPYPFKGVVNPK